MVLVSVIVMAYLDFMVSLVMVIMQILNKVIVINLDDFFYHFGFENHYGAIILVDNVVVGKNGYLSGNFVIDIKVVILLTLLIIVIFVNFN